MWLTTVAHVACAGLLVRCGKRLKCSHRILYTYLVALIASFVSMIDWMRTASYKIEIFAMVAVASLVVSSCLLGMPSTEEELKRQIQVYVSGVGGR